jgi:hypothetical protein
MNHVVLKMDSVLQRNHGWDKQAWKGDALNNS